MRLADPSRMRGAVKTGVAYALSRMRVDALVGALAETRTLPLLVGYHRVVEDFAESARRSIPAMLTSSRMLEEHLDWIGRRYRFVDLDELGGYLERGEDASRLAAITFDDGYRDFFEQAFPVLARKGVPAAVFVVTDLVGNAELQIHDRVSLLLTRAFRQWSDPARELRAVLDGLQVRLPGLERADHPLSVMASLVRALSRKDVLRVADTLERQVGFDEAEAADMLPLTWSMLAALQRAGVIIGSHTRTHAWLTQERPDKVREEIQGSRRVLERRLGAPVNHFAYPDGRFDATTAVEVAAAGYRFGYTTCAHRDEHYALATIPRKLLWQNACLDALGRFSPAIMSCQVHGIFDLVRRCDQEHGR